jgi:hypothetical protein
MTVQSFSPQLSEDQPTVSVSEGIRHKFCRRQAGRDRVMTKRILASGEYSNNFDGVPSSS